MHTCLWLFQTVSSSNSGVFDWLLGRLSGNFLNMQSMFKIPRNNRDGRSVNGTTDRLQYPTKAAGSCVHFFKHLGCLDGTNMKGSARRSEKLHVSWQAVLWGAVPGFRVPGSDKERLNDNKEKIITVMNDKEKGPFPSLQSWGLIKGALLFICCVVCFLIAGWTRENPTVLQHAQ